MKIYHDPFDKEGYLIDTGNLWFCISQGSIKRTEFLGKPKENLPPMELAQLVPVWLVECLLDLQAFFTEYYYVGVDGMDAADPRLEWMKK
jgi:hypothetical protein